MAFATALAFGEPPGQYHFAQERMHRHLWSCFERRQISMFPYRKLRRATESTVKPVDEVPVYCVCRIPELPNTRWIEALAVRGGTTQSPTSMYHVQLFLATLHGTATDVYKSVFFYVQHCTICVCLFLYIYYFIKIMLTLYRY